MKNKLRKKNIFTLGNRYKNNIGFRYISSRDNCATIKNGKMMLFTKSSNCRSIKNEYAIHFPISVSVYEDFTCSIDFKGRFNKRSVKYHEM